MAKEKEIPWIWVLVFAVGAFVIVKMRSASGSPGTRSTGLNLSGGLSGLTSALGKLFPGGGGSTSPATEIPTGGNTLPGLPFFGPDIDRSTGDYAGFSQRDLATLQEAGIDPDNNYF
jgi:hypothetical protein